ncbi:MAG TPA: efflux RND transporter periplasmic adaptor subunit [Phycisphaerales bacterium]|nr:efflux RND transporter periplasmic adaptor subunit [Phycisphaerales bacterium]HMP36550.1 efflux RND transporter periplasmic adaptor subunit [Phycisphaerales bacterium]
MSDSRQAIPAPPSPRAAAESGRRGERARPNLDALRIDRSAPSRRWPAVAALLLLGVAGGGALVGGWWAGWWGSRWPIAAWLGASAPLAEVRTIVVPSAGAAPGDRVLLNASGFVAARRLATVSSKVTGKIVEVLVEEGMKVEADQVLARIDDSNVERALRLSEAQLEANRAARGETEAALAQAGRELDRLRRAADRGAATPLEIERAETSVWTLEARLVRQDAEIEVSEHEVAVWTQQLEDTVIRAPFAGVVTMKNAQPGEMISPMSVGGFTRTGICTIVDMASLEIEVDVSESAIGRVVAGRPAIATLDSSPGWRIPARVVAIVPTADRQKATVRVRVAFDELDPRILPEMGVKVAFLDDRDDETPQPGAEGRPRLPRAAVLSGSGGDFAWVVRDGVVERRALLTAGAPGDEVSILEGLVPGERVVLDAPRDLSEGDRVKEARR